VSNTNNTIQNKIEDYKYIHIYVPLILPFSNSFINVMSRINIPFFHQYNIEKIKIERIIQYFFHELPRFRSEYRLLCGTKWVRSCISNERGAYILDWTRHHILEEIYD